MAKKITAQDTRKKLDVQLRCSICSETFKQPKVLPCFHIFCKSPCLEKLVAKDRHSLTCPTCEHVVPLSEKGVDELQSDFHIDHLVEIQAITNKAAESTNTQCDSCENRRATRYCRDCRDFLCNKCQDAHGIVRFTKNHQIITLEQLRAHANLIQTKTTNRNCPKHPENTLKIYCETCSTLICMDCTIGIHQGHNYDLVADAFPKHKEELVSSLKPVKQKLHTVQQALEVFDTRAKDINDQKSTVKARIEQEINRMHQLIDRRKEQLMGELNMLTQQKLENLAAQKGQVKITQAKLNGCLEYAEGGLQTDIESVALVRKAPVLKRIEEISAEFDPDAIHPSVEADLKFTTTDIQACLKVLEVREVEPLALDKSYTAGDGLKSASTGEQTTVVFHAMTTQNEEYQGNIDLKAELQHVKSNHTVQCEVVKQQNGQYGINYRPVKRGKHNLLLAVNGNPHSLFPIVVTPSAKSLKKPIRVIRGLDHPRNVTINSKQQLLVTDGNGTCVSILTPDGEKIKTFGTKRSEKGQLHNAFGVAVDKDDNIYVLDCDNHRIQKFSTEGKFLATVGYGYIKQQFHSPVGITYNRKDNYLYIADQCNHQIQVLNTDLTLVRSFGTNGSRDGQFNFPFNIAFDDKNKLYVTDKFNDRVQVLTTEGKFLRAFSQKANGEKLSRPWAIAIDSSNTVYVSENGQHNSEEEYEQHCVSVFTSQGHYITTFGGEGSEEGLFKKIFGLFIDDNDTIIVSDQENGRLQIY